MFSTGKNKEEKWESILQKTWNGDSDYLSGSLSYLPADECCTWKPMAQ